jgi:hypothetical protein
MVLLGYGAVPLTFAESTYWEDRALAAINMDTPKDILIRLARDPSRYVRKMVTCNPDAPKEALAILVTDEDSKNRALAAHHPNSTDFIQRVYLMTEVKYAKK